MSIEIAMKKEAIKGQLVALHEVRIQALEKISELRKQLKELEKQDEKS